MKFVSNVNLIIDKIDEVAEDAVRETAATVVDDVLVSFAQPKSGRIYGGHQASAPGESPAIDEGDLSNSIRQEKIDEASYRVGSTDEKAPHLEFGTSRIAPRPFLTPAFLKAESTLKAKLAEKLSDVGK